MIGYREAIQQANSTAKGAGDFANTVSSRDEREDSAAVPLREECTSPPDLSSSANDRSYPSPWSFFSNDGDVQEPVVGMEGMEAIGQNALQDSSQGKSIGWPMHQWSCSMETSMGENLLPLSPDTGPDFLSSLCTSSMDDFSSSTFDAHRGTSSTCGTNSPGDGSSKPGCTWIAASVLQCLESPGAPLEDNSHSLSVSQGRLRRNLDTVISTNKAVMEILHRISGCTCSVPGNHLVIISAVLFTVLAWYEACLGASDRTQKQGVGKAGSGEPGVMETRRGDADAFEEAGTIGQKDGLGTRTDDHAELVCIPPIQVGSLQLGVESRRQVVAQIVLTELAKVTKVIESLTERPCGMSSTTVGVSGYQELEAQLQFSLRAALQTRIEKISQAAGRASK